MSLIVLFCCNTRLEMHLMVLYCCYSHLKIPLMVLFCYYTRLKMPLVVYLAVKLTPSNDTDSSIFAVTLALNRSNSSILL